MAWIYRNQTEWIISLSSDGTTRITIADKNLWATQVYNDGDTLSEANCGKYYQRGNNYWFPFTWSVTTSSTKVNAWTYWPWNYYSSSTFITPSTSPYNWDSSNNSNLWGWTTWTVEAMQWPCANGFHIPTQDEWNSVASIWNNIWARSWNDNSKIYLKMPLPWFRAYSFNWDVRNSWIAWIYLSCTIYSEENIYSFLVGNSSVSYVANKCNWYSIRPFANTPVVPDRTWTKLYWDDILPPFLKWFINNWNYYYFGDAPIHISWLALDKSSISLTTVWQTEQLTATITPADAVEKTVTWSSSDTSIATVDNTWLVTCVTPGECTIIATCGEYSATCSVIQRKDVYADFLLVWWGWTWSWWWWWWGWAWWVIQCSNYLLEAWAYSVVIWAWWISRWTCGNWSNWCNSTFNWKTAYGWGGGGWQDRPWCPWWSWGWWWYRTSWWLSWWAWCSWQWYAWWSSGCYSGWWWGGAWWVWTAGTRCCGWMWWIGIQSNISWTMQRYAWWWSWWEWGRWCSTPANCWWTPSWCVWSNATICWAWWWWTYCACWTWHWWNWIFILRYPTACWHNITWWTCYTCWDYTIHCFTSNGTLTVN